MSKLIIDLNDEYKIRIEKGKEFNESIFADVYKNAARNVCEIVKQSENQSTFDVYNNIIAFTGERGKGKSSSMISFRQALINHRHRDHEGFFNSKDYFQLINKKFVSIDVIDPSLFRGSETLFEIVVAKLFSNFQNELKKVESQISHEDKRQIISDFQKVFNNLKIISGDKKSLFEKDSIEALSELAYGSNLNDSFKLLVSNYLRRVHGADFLVLVIDDFDLNIADAYSMLEDLRQFLIQKNIIILVAFKIQQLKDAITNVLLNDFSSLAKYEAELFRARYTGIASDSRMYPNHRLNNYEEVRNHLSSNRYESIGEKYLEKLFPQSHMIPMPLMKSFTSIQWDNEESTEDDSKEVIIYLNKNDTTIKVDEALLNNRIEMERLKKNSDIFTGKNLQDVLLQMIYVKTNIFISKPEIRINSIIPETLREIHNLIGAIIINEDCQEGIKNYIVAKAANDLPKALSNIFVQLEEQDANTLNFHLVNLIGRVGESLNIRTSRSSLLYLLNPKNPKLVSIGDVYSVLRICDDHIDLFQSEHVKFFDYLTIYYAIRISMTEKANEQLITNYLHGGYYNPYNKVFPIQKKGSKQRDWVVFRKTELEKLTVAQKYWIGFFIPYFGVISSDFRDRKESPYFRELNLPGASIQIATFSPLTPLSHVLFPHKIWDAMFSNQIDEQVPLYEEVLAWNTTNKYQSFLNNNMFYAEFLKILDELSKKQHKGESISDYHTAIYDYMITSGVEALRIMNARYPYVDGDLTEIILQNPVYKYWIENNTNEDVIEVMNSLFINSIQRSVTYTPEEVALARQLLNRYVKYFIDSPGKSAKGSKQAMSSVIKAFSNSPNIATKLHEYKALMEENLEEGLNEIAQYLRSIDNG